MMKIYIGTWEMTACINWINESSDQLQSSVIKTAYFANIIAILLIWMEESNEETKCTWIYNLGLQNFKAWTAGNTFVSKMPTPIANWAT